MFKTLLLLLSFALPSADANLTREARGAGWAHTPSVCATRTPATTYENRSGIDDARGAIEELPERDLFLKTSTNRARHARGKKKGKKGRRRSGGKDKRSRGRSRGMPLWLKNMLRVTAGGLVGALASPFLPEAASGIGLGIAAAGVVSGRGAWPLIAVGAGVQGIKTISRTDTFKSAAVAIQDAAQKALPSSTGGGTSTEDELVNAAGG